MNLTSARTRTIAVCLVAGALLMAAPASASATKPFRFPGDPTPTPLPVSPCSFPTEGWVTSREAVTFFSSGAVLVSGTYKVSISNPANGKTIDINASGPGRIDPSFNFSGTGLQVFFLGPDEVLGGGIYVFRGNTSFTRDENGLINSITTVGSHTGNLCAQLA